MDGIYVAIAIWELTLRSALFSYTFCLQHNLLDDESLNDRMRGGTRYDVSANEHSSSAFQCFPFAAHFIAMMSAWSTFFQTIFLVMVIHLNTIVSSRWIQQTNPHSFVVICLFPFLQLAFSRHSTFLFLNFPPKKGSFETRGKGYDKSMMAAAQENKTNPSPLLPFFLLQCHLVRPSSHMYIKILNRFTAL